VRYSFVPHNADTQAKITVKSDKQSAEWHRMSDGERYVWCQENLAELQSLKNRYEALVAGSLQRAARMFRMSDTVPPHAIDAMRDLIKYENMPLRKPFLDCSHETRAFREQYSANLRKSEKPRPRPVYAPTAHMADPFIFDRKPKEHQQRASPPPPPGRDIESAYEHDKDM